MQRYNATRLLIGRDFLSTRKLNRCLEVAECKTMVLYLKARAGAQRKGDLKRFRTKEKDEKAFVRAVLLQGKVLYCGSVEYSGKNLKMTVSA